MVSKCLCTRMRENDRRFYEVERITHSRWRCMSQIDKHTHSVHFPDDLLTERREPIIDNFIGTGICPIGIRKMCQAHIADTSTVECS